MHISVDLHSHSGASGGVGDISLSQVAETMGFKGIQVFGTGDCLHEEWCQTLKSTLSSNKNGLYSLHGDSSGSQFLLQTEIILTAEVGAGRKVVHTLLLFPSFQSVEEAMKLFDRWKVKRSIGRPFLPCQNASEVGERLTRLRRIDQGIEIIPAHVLTPQGIFGSNRPVTHLREFFAEAAAEISIVETGLSADPQILALIPELDHRTLLSNSDGHCGALNRVGREYTTLQVNTLSYSEIIQALRGRKIVRTAEFTPAEGRFFLTGHRAGKKGHGREDYCYFSPDHTPKSQLCPICGKTLTIGVLERALQLSALQGEKRTLESVTPRQPFIQVIPLIEAVAAGLKSKSCTSKRVVRSYKSIIQETGTEAAFWTLSETEGEEALKRADQEALIETIHWIRTGEYSFSPPGYDGEYGELLLGQRMAWSDHSVIHGKHVSPTRSLFGSFTLE